MDFRKMLADILKQAGGDPLKAIGALRAELKNLQNSPLLLRIAVDQLKGTDKLSAAARANPKGALLFVDGQLAAAESADPAILAALLTLAG